MTTMMATWCLLLLAATPLVQGVEPMIETTGNTLRFVAKAAVFEVDGHTVDVAELHQNQLDMGLFVDALNTNLSSVAAEAQGRSNTLQGALATLQGTVTTNFSRLDDHLQETNAATNGRISALNSSLQSSLQEVAVSMAADREDLATLESNLNQSRIQMDQALADTYANLSFFTLQNRRELHELFNNSLNVTADTISSNLLEEIDSAVTRANTIEDQVDSLQTSTAAEITRLDSSVQDMANAVREEIAGNRTELSNAVAEDVDAVSSRVTNLENQPFVLQSQLTAAQTALSSDISEENGLVYTVIAAPTALPLAHHVVLDNDADNYENVRDQIAAHAFDYGLPDHQIRALMAQSSHATQQVTLNCQGIINFLNTNNRSYYAYPAIWTSLDGDAWTVPTADELVEARRIYRPRLIQDGCYQNSGSVISKTVSLLEGPAASLPVADLYLYDFGGPVTTPYMFNSIGSGVDVRFKASQGYVWTIDDYTVRNDECHVNNNNQLLSGVADLVGEPSSE
ncbi:uncharacterized protein MONBRDRAFT_9251 [Monosiga brevicollis MX1]|uniref:Fibrillar collagen NC1 domain-containing protein n=1 Tax=Monosiga brevicollis TaxID=81824 RepID=A9V2J9_MONBE|nr:uncharacterized protein MONBRDRAFT_9251 [Monosiga brevicollis MX1]EDQ88270.1 predicted protein [Monosiga brevicollis MX1]|eukprot:XP_001746863.1 hypothetical protein [Monosiga brevicollis MX1]